jgi:LysM repeat protein
VVRSGDSPYGIAQKYGISVAELRRLNNLSTKQLIYPGQKLLISKDSGQ